MIESFRDKEAEKLASGARSEALPPELQHRARMLMARIHAATSLNDLKAVRSHQLRALDGDRSGQYSMDVDGHGQWRICFTWRQGSAFDVELVG